MSRDLVRLVAAGGVAVLSGAGISTESGLPDYRGPSGAARRHTPMTFQAFVGDERARRRYWARGFLGWVRFDEVRPNAGHSAVARLEHAGLVDSVVTQNVDGLHDQAGSRDVVDLHGRMDRVVCLGCGAVVGRPETQRRLADANVGWLARPGRVNPDGDVELDDAQVAGFVVVDCERCGGLLKPDVVFFGENVPRARSVAAAAAVDRARSLLVVGSSLQVFSGRRLVRRAADAGLPIAIVNLGPTRSDDLADVRVDAALGALLDEVATAVGA